MIENWGDAAKLVHGLHLCHSSICLTSLRRRCHIVRDRGVSTPEYRYDAKSAGALRPTWGARRTIWLLDKAGAGDDRWFK